MKASFVVLVLLLAGCLDGPDGVGSLEDEGAAESAEHGEPQRVDGEVSVVAEGDRFVASREVTVTNGYGGALFADLRLSTVSGGIQVATCDCSEYQFVARLAATGDSEEEAMGALEGLDVAVTEQLSGQLLAFWAAAQAEGNQWGRRSAQLTLMLPEDLTAMDSVLKGVNGAVLVRDLAIENLEASTTNGALDIQVQPRGEGRVDLQTTNGKISFHVDGHEVAYDVRAAVVNGLIELDFQDTQPYGTQSERDQRVRHPQYETLALKLDAYLHTINGVIEASG